MLAALLIPVTQTDCCDDTITIYLLISVSSFSLPDSLLPGLYLFAVRSVVSAFEINFRSRQCATDASRAQFGSANRSAGRAVCLLS